MTRGSDARRWRSGVDSGLGDHDAGDEPPRELFEVQVEGPREARLEAFATDVSGHELPDDLRIGLAREVEPAPVLVHFPGPPAEGRFERLQDGVARDPARRKEGSVDVEEDELVAVGG